jgi:hypothetical protein
VKISQDEGRSSPQQVATSHHLARLVRLRTAAELAYPLSFPLVRQSDAREDHYLGTGSAKESIPYDRHRCNISYIVQLLLPLYGATCMAIRC